jgi:predicted RNA-binding Zn ribbon-like protein
MTTTPGPSPIPRHPSEFACIDLINSAFTHHLGKGPGFDRLARWEWRAWFLSRHGIEVDPACPVPIDQLATLRDQLRAILWQWARTGSLTARQTDALDAWVSKAPLRQRVRQISGRPGLAVEPADRDWTWAMARIAASAAELAGNGAPERLKVCANPDCSWMFYDHTLNRSQRFCSTSPCATVVRVRRFRRSGVRPSLLAGRCMRPTPREWWRAQAGKADYVHQDPSGIRRREPAETRQVLGIRPGATSRSRHRRLHHLGGLRRSIGMPEERFGNQAAVIDPEGADPRMYFPRVPEDKTAKNRVPLDARGRPESATEERAADRGTGRPADRGGCLDRLAGERHPRQQRRVAGIPVGRPHHAA